MTRMPILVNRSARSLLLAAAAVLVGAGCAPAWTVVKQANPNPITPQTSLAVEPIRFEGLMVGKKTEEAYLADKKPEQQESWKSDLAAMQQIFSSTLVEQAKGLQVVAGAPEQGGPYLIKPAVTFIEPGVFTAMFNIPSQVHMTLQVADPQGAVVDEIRMKVSVAPGNIMGVPTMVSVGERLRECAKRLAKLTAMYLRQRAGVK
ncbi:MAG: hypothetical protein RMK29_21660 [Myxococcales bacterium]|nr:hypothetical protein [Myxococcota bacterium]MDW8284320.1 hypothetical protein [Myxococcales bacterium]